MNPPALPVSIKKEISLSSSALFNEISTELSQLLIVIIVFPASPISPPAASSSNTMFPLVLQLEIIKSLVATPSPVDVSFT